MQRFWHQEQARIVLVLKKLKKNNPLNALSIPPKLRSSLPFFTGKLMPGERTAAVSRCVLFRSLSVLLPVCTSLLKATAVS
ncbi:hypothetical protein Q8A67_006094 [Cirrhinus molitorella]|uniref:Uncharacterized protein n=1 Tax=Cirrhinus molitorella TaxID=172907 RepID=A0AA88QBX5_9TELE|nr:hypothetical protein Q8A67_006094 [Cirrhinus molitorella]